jgi:hypothetical protein
VACSPELGLRPLQSEGTGCVNTGSERGGRGSSPGDHWGVGLPEGELCGGRELKMVVVGGGGAQTREREGEGVAVVWGELRD